MKIEIENLVKKYGNNYELGKKVRELYWKHEENLQRDRIPQE